MYKVNISIDDVSPHKESSEKVLLRCWELIEIFPDIKFTLFVPTAYWRTKNHITNKPLYLQNYPVFCNLLRNLPIKNFELGFHGHFHGIPGVNNNDELYGQDITTINNLLELMFNEVDTVKLQFKSIIRPPAWRMSADAIQLSYKLGIEIFALAPFDYAIATYGGAQLDKKVVYCTSCPPFRGLKLKETTEIVYHACEWDKNYLDKIKTKELENFLRRDDIKFCFMEELA